jgi:hypothetical protein
MTMLPYQPRHNPFKGVSTPLGLNDEPGTYQPTTKIGFIQAQILFHFLGRESRSEWSQHPWRSLPLICSPDFRFAAGPVPRTSTFVMYATDTPSHVGEDVDDFSWDFPAASVRLSQRETCATRE